MKKGKQAPLLSRWWRYKWSGLITFAPIIILSIALYGYMELEKEFFTSWSCDTIEDYLLDIEVPDRFPTHLELTDDQHLKIHKIHQECVDDTPFKINEHK